MRWRVAVALLVCAGLTGCGGWGIAYMDGQDRRTPLERAAQQGDAAEVQRQLASGADPNDRAGVFGSPLAAACVREGNAEVVRSLLAAGANPNGRAPEGSHCWASPLNHAAVSGDLEIIRALLDAGASLLEPRQGCSRLLLGWLKPPVIELLVERGLSPMAVDENGRNELHLALAPPTVPRVDSIEYLVRAGVPLNARDRWGKTPLAYWREPRDYERHWFTNWLLDRLGERRWLQQQRADRVTISALLERSGAVAP